MKKLISIALVVMTCMFCAVGAVAESVEFNRLSKATFSNGQLSYMQHNISAKKSGDYVYWLQADNTIALLSIANQGKKVDIPAEIDGYPVVSLGVGGEYRMNEPVIGEQADVVHFPDSLKIIGTGSIAIPHTQRNFTFSEGLTEIGAFADPCFLTTVDLPSTLTKINDSAFVGFWGTKITFPEGLQSIGAQAFQWASLKSISIPGSVTQLGSEAFADSKLSSATLHEGISLISERMFANCGNLSKITIPESIQSIGKEAFTNCSKLAAVTFKGNSIKEILDGTFSGCVALSKIVIPDGVTSIGKEAFYGCKKLSAVTIPASVTEIGEYAFEGCAKKLVLTVDEGSYAEQWANEQGIKIKLAKK